MNDPEQTSSTASVPSSSSSGNQKDEQQKQQQERHQQHLTQEERLQRGWTNIRYTAVAAFERAQAASTAAEKKNHQDFQNNVKELDKSVVHFLKYRIEYHRLLSQIEAKLLGKAQEREALETYVRTQPRLGKRKRDETIV
jgi:lipopolysaccharide export LptBFGC system permease protein LptF